MKNEPITEGAEPEISWQPKYNANYALIADWEDSERARVETDNNSESTDPQSQNWRNRDNHDSQRPREGILDNLESSMLLKCSSQSTIITNINDAVTASDHERQESRGDDWPVQSAEDTEDIMLKPALSEVSKPQVVRSPSDGPLHASGYGRAEPEEFTSVTECQSITCRDLAKPSPRHDMSIMAIYCLMLRWNAARSSPNRLPSPC